MHKEGNICFSLAAGALFRPVPARPASPCRLWPTLAGAWLRAVFAPVSGALAALAGECPFPLAEPLALFAGGAARLLPFPRAARRLPASVPVAGRLRAFVGAGLFPPPRGTPPPPRVSAAQLTALCGTLTERLNAEDAFRAPGRPSGARALEAAALVKNTRPRPRRAQARSLSRVDARLLPGRSLRAVDRRSALRPRPRRRRDSPSPPCTSSCTWAASPMKGRPTSALTSPAGATGRRVFRVPPTSGRSNTPWTRSGRRTARRGKPASRAFPPPCARSFFALGGAVSFPGRRRRRVL